MISSAAALACALILNSPAQVHNLSPGHRQEILRSGVTLPPQLQVELQRDHQFLLGRGRQVRFHHPFRDDAHYDRKLQLRRIAITMDEVNQRWREPHRHHFTRDWHLNYVLNRIESNPDLSGPDRSEDRHVLRIAALFSKIVYDPRDLRGSAQRSLQLFLDRAAGAEPAFRDKVAGILREAMEDRIEHRLTEIFLEVTRLPLNGSLAELLEWEHSVFREHQFMDWPAYRARRIAELRGQQAVYPRLGGLIDHLRHWQPRIAVYAGSFNPLQIGHFDIISQAEGQFDKVIVARGQNPDKPSNDGWDLSLTLPHHQTAVFTGLLTDYIKNLGYPAVLIRGLRNGYDLDAEATQLRQMEEIYPDLQTASIMTRHAYSHISSSAYRAQEKIQKGLGRKYLRIMDALRLSERDPPVP